MRAVQITRVGGPEAMDIVDVPEPTPGEGQKVFAT
jgi:NADPH:quinone reductase